MRMPALLVLGIVLLMGADKDDKEKAVKKELKKFEGNWVLVSGEVDGKKLDEDAIKNHKLTIKGDKHTVKMGDRTTEGTHKVDPTKKPKEIEATDKDGEKIHGIYEFEGDTFKVCFAPANKDRPDEFVTKEGDGRIFHTWKREK